MFANCHTQPGVGSELHKTGHEGVSGDVMMYNNGIFEINLVVGSQVTITR